MTGLRQLQLVEVDLIRLFADICEKEGLRYYILGGTMLGAIRHKGYIPWDDDADVALPRADYEKFLDVSKKYLPEGYYVEDYKSCPEYRHYPSLLASSKSKVRVFAAAEEFEKDAWIDIFPLDGMPNNKLLNRIHGLRLTLLRGLFLISVFDLVSVNRSSRKWYEKAAVSLCRRIPLQKLLNTEKRLNAIDRALKKYPYEESDYLVNFMGAYRLREMFRKEVFGEGQPYDFEGMKLNGPQDYHAYLTQLYGDYMVPPPESERNHHSTEVIESGEDGE